jgi:hypothetical protein
MSAKKSYIIQQRWLINAAPTWSMWSDWDGNFWDYATAQLEAARCGLHFPKDEFRVIEGDINA